MSEKILVIGGSGFIGSHVAIELWKDGHHVAVFSRSPSKARKRLKNIEVDYIKGDIRDPRSLAKALKDVRAVVNCAQFPNHPLENSEKDFTFQKTDVEGTTNLLAACRQSGTVQRVVYISGASVSTHPNSPEPFISAKSKAEQAIIESGIPFTIFRPTWVFGREDRGLNLLIKLIRYLPFAPVLGDGNTRTQPLFILDFAKILKLALDNPKSENQIYEVSGPDTLTINQIVETILKLLHKKRAVFHASAKLIDLTARPLALLGREPLSSSSLNIFTRETLVDNMKTMRDFPLRLTSFEEALSTYINAGFGN